MKIEGYISDEEHLPIPFVAVIVKGSIPQVGVDADEDGYFTLDAPAGSTLVFRLQGYKQEEFIVPNAPASVSIILKKDIQELPETTVVHTRPTQGNTPKVRTSFNSLIKKHKKWLWIGGVLVFGGIIYAIVNSNENKKPKKVDL